ncbi:MAG: transporter [Thermodesulfovibrionales bacterium]|nr:transporter [Thermodesulfovibrionales bacterium]
MFKSVFIVLLSSFIFLLGVLAHTGHTTEGGGGAYPNGAEDFMSGAVPPPGTYFLNYLTYYTADRFNDGSGKSVIPDFDLKVTANVFRLLHVTKTKILDGYWGVHIFIPIVNVDVSLPFGSQSKTGIGDIIIDPFILSWHTKNWHFATGIDIFIPTGSYDKNRLANIGRNYWTFETIFAFSYLSDNGLDLSAKFMYDINTKNKDTDYRSGQEFHFDYTIGKKFANWGVGIGGYYYKQITSDKQGGIKVGSDGNKGQAFALGPQLKYDHKNMSFIIKYQKEMEVKNRPEGDKFWFKFVYAF